MTVDAVPEPGASPEPAGRPSKLSGQLAEAVRRHRAGDESAMPELVRTVTPWLFYLCRGYRLSTSSAEDVVQHTLMVLTQHVWRIRDPQGTLSWLSVVARREALRTITAERRVLPGGDMADFDTAVEHDDPQRVLEAKATRRVLLRNLAALPAHRRDLLRLLFLDEVTGYARIGEILDMPVGSIGPNRQRGLERLRRLLDADEEWGCAS